MSEQSAFNQNEVAEGAYVEPRGVLDQLNLPPGFVKFVRKNKRAIQITGAVIVVVVVAGSLYQSYRTTRLDDAASSLSISMDATGDKNLKHSSMLHLIFLEHLRPCGHRWSLDICL